MKRRRPLGRRLMSDEIKILDYFHRDDDGASSGYFVDWMVPRIVEQTATTSGAIETLVRSCALARNDEGCWITPLGRAAVTDALATLKASED